MKTILVLFPSPWDRRHLRPDRLLPRHSCLFAGPEDAECPWDFDAFAFLDQTAALHQGHVHGVLSSSDYPGAILAAALAERLGLPGPSPASVLRASHKYASRLAQRATVPEAVPRFQVLDPARPDLEIPYPVFVKPVKGAFSRFARRVADPEELAAHLSSPAVEEFLTQYVALFERLAGRFLPEWRHARSFLAEECLEGRHVTVEGYVQEASGGLLGVVDSVMEPRTGSFLRFDYPSSLPASVQSRMTDLALRAARGLGLKHTLFNVEMFYDPERDRISIVEVNPRMCAQFADLYEKVDGVHGYDVALAVATGETPPRPGGGRFPVACSVPLRVFEPCRVIGGPDAATLARVEREHPGTLIWIECEEGQDLCDFHEEDGHSVRYAVINLGGSDHGDVERRLEAVRRDLGFAFAPLT